MRERRSLVFIFCVLLCVATGLAMGCGSTVEAEDDATSTTGSPGAGGTGAGGGMAIGGMGGAGGEAIPCPEIAPALQAVLEQAVTPNSAGGFVIGVASPSCAGWHDSHAGSGEVPKDGLYKMGSLSQLLVAATVMTLVEDGQLSLSDTLDTWQPTVPNAASITVRMLLNQSAGLANHFTSPDFSTTLQSDPQHVFTPQELVAFSSGLPAATPGAFEREFIHTILAGLIIEGVTSQAAHVAIRERVIEPLGLTTMGLGGVEVDTNKLVPGYNGQGIEHTHILPPSAWWVSGSYIATIPDMVTLVRDVLGTDKVLNAASRQALTDMAIPTGVSQFGSGLGVFIDTSINPNIVGQEGAVPGYELRAYYAEAVDAGMVIMATNTDAKTFAPLLDVLDILNQPL